MAYSASFPRSQDVLVCGLCETNTKIKVKCMDCDLYMCLKCTDKVHVKFKNAHLHDIVALENIHSHKSKTEGKSEFKPVKCKDHRQQLCCMYCLTCRLLVCPMCIAKTHQQHLLEEIQTICLQKVGEMKKLKNRAHSTTEKLIENLHLIANIEESKSTEIEQKILEEEELARELQSRCMRLHKELKEKTKRHTEIIKEKESEILKDERDIKVAIQQVENIHNSQNTGLFLEDVNSLQTKMESFEQSASQKQFNINTLQYVPNYEIQSNSESIEMEIQFEIKAKFKIDMIHEYRYSITSDKDGNIWITDGGHKIQQLQVKKSLQTIKTLHLEVDIIQTRCSNMGILYTTTKSPVIWYLPFNGSRPRTLKDLSPCKPFSLDVCNNEIIVGMDCSSVQDKTDIPFMLRLDADGDIIQIYENHERQFIKNDVVLYCSNTQDGDICYIDSLFMDSGNGIGDVVFMSQEGSFEWNYEGNLFLNSSDNPFRPAEVLSTEHNNFIVSEHGRPAFHILTKLGDLLTIVNLSLVGVTSPGPSTIDVNGNLWISSEDKGMNKIFLSLVDFSGF
ncbi:probable E3 ubiquitin-protein ligase MID2 [Mytilus edulis]|uniref:probable E3 ubiquitin-protein ligase MID2 n=1 Tax=Mytilus edulis TaxID=6550 RepID=UPI0039F04475